MVVAAAAVTQTPVQDTPAQSVNPPAAQSADVNVTSTSSTVPAANNMSDLDRSSSQENAALLVVQCGPSAVVRLSFSQLLQLSGGAAVADVADAPAEAAAAVSTLTGTAAAGAATNNLQAPPKLLLDSMLGRLCRWLRALGIDAEFVEAGQQGQVQSQGALIQQVQEAALLQGRLFVTRDQKLAMRRDVGGSVYLLTTNDAAEQLTELSRHFNIRLDEFTLMSRCSACNAAAFQRISHEEAAQHVTERLLELVQEFWQCGKCKKVVWMGPKSYAAISLLEGLFTDGKTHPTPLQSTRNKEEGQGA